MGAIVSVLRGEMASQPSDLTVRFVALNYVQRTIDSGVALRGETDSFELDIEDLQDTLSDLVKLIEPDELREERRLRWEVVNACAVEDWRLAQRLVDRLVEESPRKASLFQARFCFAEATYEAPRETTLDYWLTGRN